MHGHIVAFTRALPPGCSGHRYAVSQHPLRKIRDMAAIGLPTAPAAATAASGAVRRSRQHMTRVRGDATATPSQTGRERERGRDKRRSVVLVAFAPRPRLASPFPSGASAHTLSKRAATLPRAYTRCASAARPSFLALLLCPLPPAASQLWAAVRLTPAASALSLPLQLRATAATWDCGSSRQGRSSRPRRASCGARASAPVLFPAACLLLPRRCYPLLALWGACWRCRPLLTLLRIRTAGGRENETEKTARPSHPTCTPRVCLCTLRRPPRRPLRALRVANLGAGPPTLTAALPRAVRAPSALLLIQRPRHVLGRRQARGGGGWRCRLYQQGRERAPSAHPVSSLGHAAARALLFSTTPKARPRSAHWARTFPPPLQLRRRDWRRCCRPRDRGGAAAVENRHAEQAGLGAEAVVRQFAGRSPGARKALACWRAPLHCPPPPFFLCVELNGQKWTLAVASDARSCRWPTPLRVSLSLHSGGNPPVTS